MTPLFAPTGCAATVVLDRESLKQTGAVTLAAAKDAKGGFKISTARSADEDRPWSPRPKPLWHYDASQREDDKPLKDE